MLSIQRSFSLLLSPWGGPLVKSSSISLSATSPSLLRWVGGWVGGWVGE